MDTLNYDTWMPVPPVLVTSMNRENYTQQGVVNGARGMAWAAGRLDNPPVFDIMCGRIHFRQPADKGWVSVENGIDPLLSTIPTD